MQEKLLLLRKYSNKTQKEVAAYLGLSLKGYRDKELGNYAFTQDEMFALASLFNKRMDEIFLPRKHQNGDKEKEASK